MFVLSMVACGGGEPPVIVTFERSQEFLGDGGDLNLTLEVSDPDGIEDVAGFTIVDQSTSLPIVEVDAAPDGVNYVANVTWDDFVALEPLDFEGTDPRTLVATVTDTKGNESAPMEVVVTLRCRRFGAVGIDDQCYNVATIGEAAARSCNDICGHEKFGFTCDAKAVLEVFDEVGMISVPGATLNGQKVDVNLTVFDCDTVGSSIPFTIQGKQYVLDPGTRATWTCNCLP